jgi:hypothetical protein
MKKLIFLLVFISMISIVSAEIILIEQPKDFYNLGDKINIPIKITTLENIEKLFIIDLICNGIETEIYKEYLILSAGEELTRVPFIPLIKNFIGRSTGTCKIKAILGDEIKLTEEFEISDEIKLVLKNEEREFYPEQDIEIEIEATKKDGSLVNGFINITIEEGNLTEPLEIVDLVKRGYSYIKFSMPKETKAEQYLIKINVFEKELSGEITNKGFMNYNIKILQVPTSLEIILKEEIIEPGTTASIKTILRDQTKEKIDSMSAITVTDSWGQTVKQIEIATDEYFEIPIIYKEPPAEWNIYAISNKIENETTFNIGEKEEIKVEIINKTLTITNIGNVIYNDTIQVKIDNITLDVNVTLGIDEEIKYILTAPDGTYEVKILNDKEDYLSKEVLLTGKSIGIQDPSLGMTKMIRHPVSWIFIIAILGFMAFTIFKKGYNKKFLAYITEKKEKAKPFLELKKNSLLKTRNKAILSLSIKGEKQNIDLICLKVKNLNKIDSKKGQTESTLQKIVNLAEENKSYIYESHEEIFLLFVPMITKTFKNQEKIIKIAQQIKNILDEHNKLFKDKIEFGISIDSGSIVAKQEENDLKFMSMGSLITGSKKIASLSEKTIFLSKKMKEKLPLNIKVEKDEKDGLAIYRIKEIKDREGNKNFINNFLQRIEKKD